MSEILWVRRPRECDLIADFTRGVGPHFPRYTILAFIQKGFESVIDLSANMEVYHIGTRFDAGSSINPLRFQVYLEGWRSSANPLL